MVSLLMLLLGSGPVVPVSSSPPRKAGYAWSVIVNDLATKELKSYRTTETFKVPMNGVGCTLELGVPTDIGGGTIAQNAILECSYGPGDQFAIAAVCAPTFHPPGGHNLRVNLKSQSRGSYYSVEATCEGNAP